MRRDGQCMVDNLKLVACHRRPPRADSKGPEHERGAGQRRQFDPISEVVVRWQHGNESGGAGTARSVGLGRKSRGRH
jgi:hypothetical protein